MTDKTKVMIAIAGTALVVGGATAVASGGKGAVTGSTTTGSTAPGVAPSYGFGGGKWGGGMRGGGPGPGFRGGPQGGLHGDAFGAAADYLGLTRQQLAEQLAAGKSLAQVAAAQSGKTVDGLKAAIKAEAKKDVEADVAAGRVTPAERDAFLAELDARVTALVNRTGLPGRHGPGPGDRLHHGGPLAFTAAAKYLGLTPMQIGEQLRAGKSLAEIAAAQGKTVAGLKNAIVADAKTRLDGAVVKGWMTSAQGTKLLDALKSKLDAIVQNKGFAHPGGKSARPRGKTAAFRGTRA